MENVQQCAIAEERGTKEEDEPQQAEDREHLPVGVSKPKIDFLINFMV